MTIFNGMISEFQNTGVERMLGEVYKGIVNSVLHLKITYNANAVFVYLNFSIHEPISLWYLNSEDAGYDHFFFYLW